MAFLLKMFVFLVIVIALLPAGQQGHYSVYRIVSSTMQDMSGLCDRKPETCQQAYTALKSFGAKVQYAGNALIDAIPKGANEQYKDPQYFKQSKFEKNQNETSNNGNSDKVNTIEAEFSNSENTLKADDLNVEWQGPDQQDIGV